MGTYRCMDCEIAVNTMNHIHCSKCGDAMCRHCYHGKLCSTCQEEAEKDEGRAVEVKDCAECGGEGRVWNDGGYTLGNLIIRDNFIEFHTTPCKACKGTGKVVSE